MMRTSRRERTPFWRGVDLGIIQANVFGGPAIIVVGVLVTSWLMASLGVLSLGLGLVAWRFEGWRWTP